MPAEPTGNWPEWIMSIVAALGIGGIFGGVKSWANQGRLEERIVRLEAEEERNRETREAMIGLRIQVSHLRGRVDRGFGRVESALGQIREIVSNGHEDGGGEEEEDG